MGAKEFAKVRFKWICSKQISNLIKAVANFYSNIKFLIFTHWSLCSFSLPDQRKRTKRKGTLATVFFASQKPQTAG